MDSVSSTAKLRSDGNRSGASGDYTGSFFEGNRGGSEAAARVIVPILRRLLYPFPRSVIDVGCGVGAFLSEFSQSGVLDILGIDGDWVPVSSLLIPPDRFRAANLERPLAIGRRFELAACLEVAEHLPQAYADTLIRSLIELAPVILFSAAVPKQAGIHHVNCQWPDYWARKFRTYDYLPVDALREALLPLPEVATWYAQNTLLYVERSYIQTHEGLHRCWDPKLRRVPFKLRVEPPHVFAYKIMNVLPPLPREWVYSCFHESIRRLKQFLPSLGRR